jgi:CBS domain-containing protein
MVEKNPKKKLKGRHKRIKNELKSMTVYDIMTKDVIAIDSQNSLATFVNVLKDRNISGMPVLEHDELVGVISKKDIFKLFGINDLNELTEEMMEKLKTMKVKDLMKKPITIYFKSSIEKAASMMKKYSINRLIVVDKNKKMVGIISKTDLVKGASKVIVKKRIETTIDEVLKIIEEKGSITIDEIAKKFHVDVSVIEEWAKILEEHRLASINYPIIGKPYLSLIKESE